MAVLESSILKTLGSGRWGLAADLIDRLRDTPPGPGVAAIRARQLMDDGDLVGAERLLESVESQNVEPAVRSALRQTQLALGWRTGNRELIRTAAQTLLLDAETPGSVREIAQLFVDADLDAAHPSTLMVLASRFAHMSQTQAANGLDFFSAVALHNASVAYLAAANYEACLDAARQSFAAFSRLHFQPAEALSTHSIVAVALMESGRDTEARLHIEASAEKGRELADVPALIAVAFLAAGRDGEARALIARAQALEQQGRGDVAGAEVTDIAEALALMAESPSQAIELLMRVSSPPMLDLGLNLERRTMLAHAYLAAGQQQISLEVASAGLEESRRRGACRSELRLAVLTALASEDRRSLATAIRNASGGSRLALSELADVICRRLDLADQSMSELGAAISSHPRRWLPLLRQALGQGAPTGHHAAALLDAYGEARDVGVLRAYARTYRSRGASPKLGLALAQRTSPRLRIHDLGRVTLEIADRSVALGGMRRKPAALLLNLASRPAYTAHRDQVIDDLWPDADPASAINSLNQSLYFLRREIEPWYEDGVSPDYVGFAGDLVWLDADLVSSDGAGFLAAAQTWKQGPQGDSVELLRSYAGHFAPEFEYEEWALSFRSKLKSKFLEVASGVVTRLIRAGEFEDARGVAVIALEADETASDLERILVWLQWRLGAKSAAKAQYDHLVRRDQLDGLEPVPLLELVLGPPPLGT
jgi:DNA-binding SARP family transcriptional activator